MRRIMVITGILATFLFSSLTATLTVFAQTEAAKQAHATTGSEVTDQAKGKHERSTWPIK